MKPRHGIGRRSFLAQVTGGAVLAGGALALAGSARAGGQGVTDCDPTDPGGRGTGRRPRTGITDRDGGATADPPGCGRSGAARPPTDTARPPGNEAQRTARCEALVNRVSELGRRRNQPEGWSDEQLRQAELDQTTVSVTNAWLEQVGRRVMRREITSEEGYRQLEGSRAVIAPIAARYNFADTNSNFAGLDAQLRILIGRARAAEPQRAALNQELQQARQEIFTLNCFNQ